MPLTKFLVGAVVLCTTSTGIAQVQQNAPVVNPYFNLSTPAAKNTTPAPSPSLQKQAPATDATASAKLSSPNVKKSAAKTTTTANSKTSTAGSTKKATPAAQVNEAGSPKLAANVSAKKPAVAKKKKSTPSSDSLRIAKAKANQASDSINRANNPQQVLALYAQKLSVSDSVFRVPSLYLIIDEWLGTPYRYGRNDKRGTDCSGLIGKIFSNFFPDALPRSAAGMSAVIDSKPIDELKEGDLVFFNYYGRRNSHVGLYLQNGWFIHASNVNGVTLNNLHSDYYRKRFSKGGPLKIGDFETLAQSGGKEKG